MQKHDIVSLVKPLPKGTDLAPLERLANIGYRSYSFSDNYWQNSGKPVIELYIRDGYKPQSLAELEPKNGFIALYRDMRGSIDFAVLHDGPQGQTPFEQALKDCKEIEGKILRQGILSWPPKFLKSDHFKEYGFLYSSLLYLGVSTAILLHLANDKSNIEKFIRYAKEYPGIIHVSMVAHVVGFLVSAYVGKWFGPYVGSIGDRIRVRKMSERVTSYKFGEDALEAIKKDLKEAELESEIIRLFDIKKGKDGHFFRQELLRLLQNPNKQGN